MNLVTSCLWVDRAVLGSNENSSIMAKYPTFAGVFLTFWQKKLFGVYIVEFALKSCLTKKLKKWPNLASKNDF